MRPAARLERLYTVESLAHCIALHPLTLSCAGGGGGLPGAPRAASPVSVPSPEIVEGFGAPAAPGAAIRGLAAGEVRMSAQGPVRSKAPAE